MQQDPPREFISSYFWGENISLKQLDKNIQLQASKVNLKNAGPEVGESGRSSD